ITLAEALDRMHARIPLPDVNFFKIVVSIQQQSGGSLSEALGNLSTVLRARTQMAAKVKALSAEAKASAGILAALPFFVMGSTYMLNPDYIALLWRESIGHAMLAGAAIWMSIGILVMRSMINFKY
ncbi:MAG: type II secretion system F family protein, partial [Pseudomonadota bacterium]